MGLVVQEYLAVDGTSPYRRWLETLDLPVWEARIAFGPGYRLYFGRVGREVILLLLGGDKGSQTRDIRTAKRYWAEFLEVMKHGKS